MADAATEKQHLPSAKRLEDLRMQGQTMRSRDLTSGMVFISGIISISVMASHFGAVFEKDFVDTFTQFRTAIENENFFFFYVGKLAKDTLLLLLPLLMTVFIATFLSPFLFGGWNFSIAAAQFKMDKLNPLNYFKHIFSVRILIEILRAMLKVIFIMTSLIYFTYWKKAEIGGLSHLPSRQGILTSLSLTGEFVTVMAVVLIFIIAFDVLYHYFEYQNRVKMTSQELKDEHKESEGNPEIKRKLRATQFSLLRQRLTITVPQASVIITNPTHYAIALRYDERKDKAPKIVAKGKDYIATQIRQIAIANGIPIYEAPPLARAIYHTANIGGEVHPGLYVAVAIVLTYVMQLKRFQQTGGEVPKFNNDLKIPEEFIYHD
jgi:flagellar biosynthesis protein FlhB